MLNKLNVKFNKLIDDNTDILKNIDVIYNIVIFAILTIFLVYVGIHHEPFRDENQAWNIARDLSVIDIFKQMYYEGHPCLWHLILKPFTLILPIYSMTWISVIIMLITAFLILFKAPFNKFVRTIFVFSSPFLYFYSVISRSYCLIALIITLICIFYKSRKEKPLIYGVLIFLLFNTHVIMAGMASILLFLFILESFISSLKEKRILKKNFIGCLIGTLGGILLVLQIIGGYEINSLVSNVGIDEYEYTEISEYVDTLIDNYKQEYYFITDQYLSESTILSIVIILGIVLIISLIFNFKNSFIFIVSYGFSLFVCLVLFYSIPSRSIIIIFLLMFMAWTMKEENEYLYKCKFINWIQKFHIPSYLVQVVMIVYCFLSIPYGYKCAINDVEKLMTDAPNVAKFIKNNIDKDSIILSSSENLTTVILGYLPDYSFYSIENERYFTFVTWDKGIFGEYTIIELNNLINKLKREEQEIYYLFVEDYNLNINNHMIKTGKLELLYESSGNQEYLNSAQEYVKYYIYKVIG